LRIFEKLKPYLRIKRIHAELASLFPVRTHGDPHFLPIELEFQQKLHAEFLRLELNKRGK